MSGSAKGACGQKDESATPSMVAGRFTNSSLATPATAVLGGGRTAGGGVHSSTSEHCTAPSSDSVPGAQGPHVPDPLTGLNVPGGHARQSVPFGPV
eukprot:2770585-Rhodomonas_salina.1